jgi:hypothetical protein
MRRRLGGERSDNDVADFSKVKAAGYAGIIHKATEAIGFVDKMIA